MLDEGRTEDERALYSQQTSLSRYNRLSSLVVRPSSVALLVFALALALYARTGTPTLLTGDQAEHQFTAWLVGVPHATGYPLFTMLNALAVRLLPFGDVARRVTLMTALWSALAVVMAYVVARRISGSMLAGLLAAATLATSAEFWALSVIAEVYTLQVFLILLVWWCLLGWWQTQTPRWLYGAALCSGVAVTHHGSFVPIVVPALLFAVALPLLRGNALSPRARWGIVARCVGWGALGLTPWLYLAAQFALFAPFDYYRGQGLPYHYYWGYPASWRDVVNLALGAGFRGAVFTHGWDNLLALSLRFVTTLRREVWWGGFGLGGLGGVVLLLRQPLAGRWSALVFIGAALFGINVAADIPKAHVYYLPAYAMWSVWAGVGAGWLAAQARDWFAATFAPPSCSPRMRGDGGRWISAGLLALLALPLLLGWHRFERLDRSADAVPRRFAAAVLDDVAPNAVILCRWELCQPIHYLQFVEGRRLDVQLDQTEPEAGADWAERAAIYLPQHPVYALQFNQQLAERYPLFPVSESIELWQVLAER